MRETPEVPEQHQGLGSQGVGGGAGGSLFLQVFLPELEKDEEGAARYGTGRGRCRLGQSLSLEETL